MSPGGEEHTAGEHTRTSNDPEIRSPLESSLRRDRGRTLSGHYKNGEKGHLYLGLPDASNSPVTLGGISNDD